LLLVLMVLLHTFLPPAVRPAGLSIIVTPEKCVLKNDVTPGKGRFFETM